jgi:hypothetical protein
MTQQYRFTEEQFTEAMKAAVAERGEDYVYPHAQCRYRGDDGAPRCIVGVAVFKLDESLRLEELGADGALRGIVPDHVRRAAAAAQVEQDGVWNESEVRKTWGEALAVYLDKVANPEPDSETE